MQEMIECKRCGFISSRRAVMQLYCDTCSIEANEERLQRAAAKKPRTSKTPSDVQRRKSQAETDRLTERGVGLSNSEKRGMTWPTDQENEIMRLIRVSIPFSWNFSKNRIYTLGGRGGHVALRKETRDARAMLCSEIQTAIGNKPFYQGKVWLDILVQKPNNKGDAVNVVDSVCDAVKVAIGVDDRYFSIRCLDWEIVKENPRLIVGVGQSITEDHFCCAYCGRHQPLTEVSSQKRTCKDCRFKKRAEKKLKSA